MNLLDIFIIVPLVWFAYKGLIRGLVLELASLVGLVLGIWAAIHFSHHTEQFLVDSFHANGQYLPVIAFILTFLAVLLVIFIIGKIIEKLIDLVALSFINKLLGLVFGLLKGSLLVSVALFVINSFDTHQRLLKPHIKENSLFYAPLEKIVPTIMPWVDLDRFREKKQEMEEGLPMVMVT